MQNSLKHAKFIENSFLGKRFTMVQQTSAITCIRWRKIYLLFLIRHTYNGNGEALHCSNDL